MIFILFEFYFIWFYKVGIMDKVAFFMLSLLSFP